MQTKDRRDQLLDRLCLYRAIYARRGRLDNAGVISVDAAIVWAERLMADPELLEQAVNRLA